MPIYEVGVDCYVTEYYTVEADNEKEAEEKVRNGKGEYSDCGDTEWCDGGEVRADFSAWADDECEDCEKKTDACACICEGECGLAKSDCECSFCEGCEEVEHECTCTTIKVRTEGNTDHIGGIVART